RAHTISMAIPGSIIDNCQSLELKTYVAGQIARAAAIYNIDEIIVYNESPTPMKPDPLKDPNVFLARLLLYQECPQYLRKEFFPVHPSLRFAGLLNPLDAPHHVRVDEKSLYRDGVVLAKKPPGGAAAAAGGCLVNCGLRKDVYLAGKVLQPGVRVTVRMRLDETGPSGLPIADPVSRSTPREADGVYWGYTVRLAEGLHNVFAQGPGGNEYDLKIGTSERGVTLTHAVGEARRRSEREGGSENVFPTKFKRALIVFGGVKGVEAAIDADEQLHVAAEDAHTLFDHWINTCPGQGSRTIRTEEAVLVSLAVLR
ncbi:putative RNA methyltransferase, partial [Catenaria anguillulae PL171]